MVRKESKIYIPNNPYQIHKSAYFALSSVFSCTVIHYYSVEFPVTDAFHVESVHKTHSCCLYMCGVDVHVD